MALRRELPTEDDEAGEEAQQRRLSPLPERWWVRRIPEAPADTREPQIIRISDGSRASDGAAASSRAGIARNGANYNAAGPSTGFTFDIGLASLHTYLGEVDDTQRRLTSFDGGTILNLPLFYLEGVVLFPEATLPLRVTQAQFIAAAEKALNNVYAPYTIGVVRSFRCLHDREFYFSSVGTTAEIRKFSSINDGSLNIVTRGRQRFYLRRHWTDVDGATFGEVEIVPEGAPMRTPTDAFGDISHGQRCTSLCASDPKDRNLEFMLSRSSVTDVTLSSSCCASSSNSKYADDDNLWLEKCGFSPPLKERSKKLSGYHRTNMRKQASQAPLSFWPHWVYDMFDSYSLAQRAADLWSQVVANPSMSMTNYMNNPDLLSFMIASKIPVPESSRQELLEINGVSLRLRREIELLKAFNNIRCRDCLAIITRRCDMVIMSTDGPLNAFVNPHGHVHEVITVYSAKGLVLFGNPTREHSWFPGYAWTIASCNLCGNNLGWLFTAVDKKLVPSSFWGIRSTQIADYLQSDFWEESGSG